MNCEQRYNNALKRARIGLHDCNLLDCDNMTRKAVITTIYHLFPELAEDEDERIRKGIIRNLQYLMDRSEGFVKEDLQERIAWLEKQGESTITNIEIPFWANDSELQEVSYNIPEGFYAEIKDDRVVIKKVEPKFKVGDWVIKNGIVAQILDKQKYGFVGLDIDGKDFFCNYGHTDSMHLWTINDAKDGDVLVNGSNIFIFRFIYDTCLMGYCHVNIDNGRFYDDIGRNECFCLIDAEVTPATKEQRDMLFQKMKEADYECNSEKKELKKIESKKLDADKVIEWMRVKAPKWLYDTVYPIRLDVDVEDLIKQFKKDFGL